MSGRRDRDDDPPVGSEDASADAPRGASVDGWAESALLDCLDSFWRAGRGLERLAANPQPPPVPLPILRRLGQPDFLEADLARLLGPAIAGAAEAARRLAEGGPELGPPPAD
jgi:hypothetical protein